MVTIYEPIYQTGQVLTEPLFVPFEHTSNARYKDWRELRIFVDMYRQGKHKVSSQCGMFSPKFSLKTKISAAKFIEFCEANSEIDACFINPFPHLPYYSYNIWMQAEANHPGITLAAQNLLDAAGVPICLQDQPRHSHDTIAYSSFWVGSQKFWDMFVGDVLEKIAVFLDEDPQHPAALGALTETYHSDPAPFLPFIVERMFTTYISVMPELTRAAYRLNPLEYCHHESERKLVEQMIPEIDAADALEEFPKELKDRMWQICEVSIEKGKHHYAKNPHPHTGRTIPYSPSSK